MITLYVELTSASSAYKNMTCLTNIELGIYSTVIYCAITTFIYTANEAMVELHTMGSSYSESGDTMK